MNLEERAAELRGKLVGQVRRAWRWYVASAAAWHEHRAGCPRCCRLKWGADRKCLVGPGLIREARRAKAAVNLASEDLYYAVGKAELERVAAEEVPAGFRPVPG